MDEQVRCKKCGESVSIDQAQHFKTTDIELCHLFGTYCPGCYEAVKAKYHRWLRMQYGFAKEKLEITRDKAGLIGLLDRLLDRDH